MFPYSHSSTVSFYGSYRRDMLWEAVDRVNEKFGDHTVPNGYGSDRYERMKLVREANSE